MERQYYRKKIISAKGQPTQWLSMDNQEYDQFLSSPEAADRYFIDFGNCILEASYEQYAKWRREQDHHNYLKKQESYFTTISMYSDAICETGTGEDVIPDSQTNVEEEVLLSFEAQLLRAALDQLDAASFQLIYWLFLAKPPKSEMELAQELGLSQPAVNRQKKKILKKLKFLVINPEKSTL